MLSKSFIIAHLFFFCYSSQTNGQTVDEYTLKAVWLGKFTHFIDWPELPSDDSIFKIGVIGHDPFNGKLESIYKNYTVYEKPVEVVHINSIDSIHIVQILFIAFDNKNNLGEIINLTKDKGVLLVSDSKGFGEKGTHINFYFQENRIRFEMNETSLKDSGFFVSFRLLNIAKIIDPISNE